MLSARATDNRLATTDSAPIGITVLARPPTVEITSPTNGILMPLADLVGVNRQIAVSAYTFGDGFTNMVYPTNAALLITLSLTVIPYMKWLKWLLKLWFWIILATIAFLAIAIAIDYGPF